MLCSNVSRTRSAVVIVSLLAAACAPRRAPAGSTQPADPPGGTTAVTGAALASRGAHRMASSLADEVGPRLAGSPGDVAAVAWAERTMRILGLANVHVEPVDVPVWRRGEERAELVGTAGERSLDVNALGWSGSTGAEGIEAQVVRVATPDELAKLPDSAVRGQIVLIDAVMARTPDGSGYGRAIPMRYAGQTAAAAKGAVATLIRSLGTDPLAPHTGSTNRGDSPGIPIGALSNASADRLARAVAAGPTRVRLVLASQRLPDARSANVVGEVVGVSKPDEVVLLGAHLDSWDTGRGALDDGAGCGVVLDAMRLLLREKPARTVRVVLFAAEENSRAGGKQYAEAHAGELPSIVLSLEVDGGTDRVLQLGFVGDPGNAGALRSIAAPLAPLGVRFVADRAHPGSDVVPLVAAGVPSVDLRQDVSRYFDLHHTRNDTSDKLDPEALAQVTAVVAHVALRAAASGVSFGRVPAAGRAED